MNIQYLKERKFRCGMNSVALAKKIGVSPVSITQWENGSRKPAYDKIIKLCKALDMDANILLGLKGE